MTWLQVKHIQEDVLLSLTYRFHCSSQVYLLQNSLRICSEFSSHSYLLLPKCLKGLPHAFLPNLKYLYIYFNVKAAREVANLYV